MESFIIEGGHPLSGTITPQGAKNEALEVICATLLTTEPVAISNIPDILDVNNLIRLLTDIGVKVQRTQPGTLVFQADDLNLAYLQSTEFVKKCSSLMSAPIWLSTQGRALLDKLGTWVSSILVRSLSVVPTTTMSLISRPRSCADVICCWTKPPSRAPPISNSGPIISTLPRREEHFLTNSVLCR